jgi:hypothetical protein
MGLGSLGDRAELDVGLVRTMMAVTISISVATAFTAGSATGPRSLEAALA